MKQGIQCGPPSCQLPSLITASPGGFLKLRLSNIQNWPVDLGLSWKLQKQLNIIVGER